MESIQTRGVGNMDITINDTVVKHAVWVAEIDKAIDGILGFDFLQSNQCVIDAGTNTFKLNGQPKKCTTVELKSIRCCRVVVDGTGIVPPGVEGIIPARVLDLENAPSCAVLVPTGRFTERCQLLMAGSVVSAEDSCVPVGVLNPSERLIEVYEMSVTATCETVPVQSEVPTFSYSTTGLMAPCLADLLEESSKYLGGSQKSELVGLLVQFNQVFTQHKTDLARTDLVRHSIRTEKVTPICQRPQRLLLTRRGEVKGQIEEMLKQDMTDQFYGLWACPIVLVRKKDGSTMFCLDYRRLNKVTVPCL
ncbi:hypothetical protein ACJMK2_032869 [Sinanodonta woodiana]|uniref:Uncharacterized protein n=1 Tax=Sinanodonta woodiana TaxID=1069815 RepID=A0ABD3X6Z0_SINWO